MKAIVFDSGVLINLSMNGLLYIIEELKKKFDCRFLITNQVKYETIDRPMGIERFELGALQIQSLIDSKVLEMPSSIGIDEEKIKKDTLLFLDKANHFMQVRGKWVNLVEEAEMSCLALSKELTEKGIDNLVAVDERTARMICENPQNLERIMSEKLHQNVNIATDDIDVFSNFRFIRSPELVYVAYKKNIIHLKGEKVLEAALYATKFKGASISFEEINKLKSQ